MKCAGKQQPYPYEIEALNKKRKEKQFIDVIGQTEVNKKNLKVLDETFENEIDNVEENLRNQNEDLKQQIKSLKDEVNGLRENLNETINRVEKQSMTSFTDLSSRVDAESVLRKVRAFSFILLRDLKFRSTSILELTN